MGIDVCLVSPPKRAYNHHRPPLALMLLASVLEKNGIRTGIIDPKSEKDIVDRQHDIIMEYILEQIGKLNPGIVGITCYTPEFNDVILLSNKIKELHPHIKIIVGGVHPTLRQREFFFEGSPVDFVVIGEGEITLYELAHALLTDENHNDIPGIGYYDKTKKEYVQTKARPLIDDLDAMPFPAYDKVDMKYYTLPNPYSVRGLFLSSFYILVGRGCPSQCTFCVSAEMRKILAPGKSLRCRSAKNVVDEIELLKKTYGIDSFYFIDDNFTIQKDLVSNICDELIKRKLNLIWACSARINTVSEELLQKMKKSGCIQVDFGVESGSPEVLKRLKKGIKVDQVKNIFEICHRTGMRTFANILINTPEETEEDLNLTLDLLDTIHPTVTSFNIFIPYIGTEIYEKQNVNLDPDEYHLLSEPPRDLVLDPRFRFAKHNLDFNEFYKNNHKKYNSLFAFLPDYFSITYAKQIFRSRRKAEYFFQTGALFKEFIKQIWQT
ncbi:Ribosomal protein S12 methylthiotransferase RimO [uncultured archaeon]|nr:Ribosomal protein S12 methylthiotransferase RimO [uncultured archaeon]